MHKISFNKKILIAFSLIFCVIIMLIASILFLVVHTNFEAERVTYLENYGTPIAHQVDAIIDNANQISVRSMFSSKISEAFSRSINYPSVSNAFAPGTSCSTMIESDLFTIAGMDVANYIINFYNENGFFSSKYIPMSWESITASMQDGHIADVAAHLKSQPLYISKIDSLYWSDRTYSNKENTYISVARQFTNYTTYKPRGVVEILIPIKYFYEVFSSDSEELGTILFSTKGDPVYSTISYDQHTISILSNTIISTGFQPNTVITLDRTHRAYIQKIGNYDLYIASIQYIDYTTYSQSLILIIASGLLLYAIALGTYILILNRLSRPLNRTIESIRTMSWNQFEMNLDTSNNAGDLDMLQEAYDAMIIKLNESINLIVDSRINEQKAVYLALQSQISPHFINNTIANISACAYDNGIQKIVDICEKLSGMLRYSSNYSPNASLIENELDYTNNYLELMKIRYENRFFFDVSCDTDCLTIPIPRLMIQTVIENCFKHAFSHAPAPWYISVQIYTSDGWWYVDIHHNGVPIEEERLRTILKESESLYNDIAKGLQHLNTNSLGLLNSITRLRMLYQNQVVFKSIPNNDTNSIMRFGGKVQ